MYIGKLNDYISPCTVQMIGEGGQALTCGNPFAGELCKVAWRAITPSGLTIRLGLAESVWLERVVLHFAEASAPTAVLLYDADGREFDRYVGETGCAITKKEIELFFTEQTTALSLRIETDLSDVILDGIELWGAALTEETVLYPTPVSVAYGGERYPITAYTTAASDCAEGSVAVAILSEKLAELAGVRITEAELGSIRFVCDAACAAGGYTLAVAREEITISAADLRGFVQGVERLCSLCEGGEVPACHIADAPFCPFRGVHLFLPAPDQMDFTKRLIKYLLSPMGYNTLIIEVAGAMRFRSHPEINEAVVEANQRASAGQWPQFPHGAVGGGQIVEQEDVRDLCAYARRFGMEVIPEVQSLGHVQFMTLAHPEIGEVPEGATVYEETDERLADVPPDAFYPIAIVPPIPVRMRFCLI